MLRIRRSYFLLCNRKYGKRRRAKNGWPESGCQWKWSEVVRQERRIEHHIPGNVSDDSLVKQAIARAKYGFPIAENVPGESDPRREVVVIGIVNSINIGLQDDTGSP